MTVEDGPDPGQCERNTNTSPWLTVRTHRPYSLGAEEVTFAFLNIVYAAGFGQFSEAGLLE